MPRSPHAPQAVDYRKEQLERLRARGVAVSTSNGFYVGRHNTNFAGEGRPLVMLAVQTMGAAASGSVRFRIQKPNSTHWDFNWREEMLEKWCVEGRGHGGGGNGDGGCM